MSNVYWEYVTDILYFRIAKVPNGPVIPRTILYLLVLEYSLGN